MSSGHWHPVRQDQPELCPRNSCYKVFARRVMIDMYNIWHNGAGASRLRVLLHCCPTNMETAPKTAYIPNFASLSTVINTSLCGPVREAVSYSDLFYPL